ncbi:MAG: hypothetical protein AAGH17_02680, partial [Pseudomonadota bacterium]
MLHAIQRSVLTLILCLLLGQAAGADTDEPDTTPTISVELNSVTQLDSACRLTFVAQNTLQDDIESLVLEAVAFGTDGGVALISLYDFQDLPALKLRVRQFDLQGKGCDDVGRILINGVQDCAGGSAT